MRSIKIWGIKHNEDNFEMKGTCRTKTRNQNTEHSGPHPLDYAHLYVCPESFQQSWKHSMFKMSLVMATGLGEY